MERVAVEECDAFAVEKDRSSIVNKTAVLPELVQGACGGFAYLAKMLPQFYQTCASLLTEPDTIQDAANLGHAIAVP